MEKLIQYIVANTSHTRRSCAEIIKQGQVQVNGKVITQFSYELDPKKDTVIIKDKKVTAQKTVYYKFNKPKGIICSLSDPTGRRDLSRYLAPLPESVFAIGRLDRNTTGLLLLTNDGELANRVSHPRYHLDKTYFVQLNKPLTKADAVKLIQGIMLEDGPVKYKEVTSDIPSEVIVRLAEGRNHIVRRTFSHLGYEIQKLKRNQIGPITMTHLKPGAIKPLSPHEVRALKTALNMI